MWVLLVALVLLLPLVSVPRAAAAPVRTRPAAPSISPSRTVVAKDLPARFTGKQSIPHGQPPLRTASPSAPSGPLQGLAPVTVQTRGAADAPARSPHLGATHPSGTSGPRQPAGNGYLLNQRHFIGATLNNTGCCEPPDTQIAVGYSQVVEMVNLTAFVYDRGGNQLGSFNEVSLFSGAANANGSDPKIVYDATISRYIATLMVCFDAGCGGNWSSMENDIAISNSDNALGGWTIYPNLFAGDQGNLQDQEKLGYSGDKVTVSVNVYRGHSGCGCDYLHEDLIVLQKSDMVAAVGAHYAFDNTRFGFGTIPASQTSAGSTSTQYVVWNRFGSMGIAQITGTPNAGNVNFDIQTPTIGNMTGTVAAPGIPDVGNNEFESAVWKNNDLWTTATDGCVPSGDTVMRDCARIVEVNTSTPSSMSVVVDVDLNTNGGNILFPSVTKDYYDNLFVGSTYAVPGSRPMGLVAATKLPCCGFTAVAFDQGDVDYSGGRWGDYSGIVQDPRDSAEIWTAQEVGARTSSGNWATSIAEFTYEGPYLTAESASFGPASGGNVVQLGGYGFADGVNAGTSVHFGSASAGVTVLSDGALRTTAPGGSPGGVSVTVTTPNGTSSALTYTYIAAPTVTGVYPGQGYVAGGQTLTVSGTGFQAPGGGAQAVRFGTTSATSYTVSSDTSLTAVVPALAEGVYDVRVTTVGGTSAVTVNDRYSVTRAVPHVDLSSSLNPATTQQTVTLTSHVAPGSGAAVATGSVTFVDGVSALGTVALSSGAASLTVAMPAVGARQLRAQYSGSTIDAPATSPVLVQQLNFTDVPTGASFAGDIYWFVTHRFTTGYADGSFLPASPVARQAFAAFLYRYAHDGSDAGVCAPGTSSFPDVPDASPFCGDIRWLAGTGITGGFADGGFHPSALVTRQAAAAFFYRFKHGGTDAGACAPGTSQFPDVADGSPFCGDIAWLAGTTPVHITTGFSDGGFHPADNVARQAVSAYFHRYDIDFAGIHNGGFEAGYLADWASSGAITGVSPVAHSGGTSGLTGSPATSNGLSSISQSFTAQPGNSTVSFWWESFCPDSVTFDWATATLQDVTAGTTTTVLAPVCAATVGWSRASSAVTAGHQYVLTLSNRDDNFAGDATYTRYDDVTVS